MARSTTDGIASEAIVQSVSATTRLAKSNAAPAGFTATDPRVSLLVGTVLLLCTIKLAFMAMLAGFRHFDPDEFEHMRAAWFVWTGEVPYRDFFEHHTPLIYFLLAPFFRFLDVAHDPDSAATAFLFFRFLMLCVVVATLALQYGTLRVANDRPVALVAVLLMLNSDTMILKGIEIRPDVVAGLFIAAALWALAASRAARSASGRRTWFAVSGIALGLALLLTQKVLLALPGVFLATLVIIVLRRWEGWKAPVLDAAAQAIGFLIPIAVMLAGFAQADAAGKFIYFNFLLNADWPIQQSPIPKVIWFVSHNPELILGLLLGAIVLLLQLRRRQEVFAEEITALGVVLSLAAGLFVLPVLQPQYFYLGLPALALIAALGYGRLASTVLGVPRLGRAVLSCLIGFIALQSVVQIAFRMDDPRNDAQLDTIEYIIAESPPEATTVSGWNQQIPFRPSDMFYRFVHGEMCPFIVGGTSDQFAAALSQAATRPALVAIEPENCLMSPASRRLLEAHYVPTGHENLWKRRD
jgi:4-amino-4-deoxy-L-arabinose transferase-like glycosyltransferase